MSNITIEVKDVTAGDSTTLILGQKSIESIRNIEFKGRSLQWPIKLE